MNTDEKPQKQTEVKAITPRQGRRGRMIVHPDFLHHWKTKKLIQITGEPGAPLAIIRLWAHCQTSRKCDFPELRKADLASICEWNFPKCSCEKALIACRWIEKMSGGGYHVRNWPEHNRILINNWNRNPSGLPKHEKSTAPHGDPVGEPAATPIRPVQTSSDLISSGPRSPVQPGVTSSVTPAGTPGVQNPDKSSNGGVGRIAFNILERLDGKASMDGKASRDGSCSGDDRPTLETVRTFLINLRPMAALFAKDFHEAMTKSNWTDNQGRQIRNWKKMADKYSDTAERNARLGK